MGMKWNQWSELIDLAEMVIRSPSTKKAKRNMIHQKAGRRLSR